MKPGRPFPGARTPRLALLLALLGSGVGCAAAKPAVKTPSPNLRLPNPSNVSTTPRDLPPKAADASPPVSIRKPPAPDVPPTMTGPGVSVAPLRPIVGDAPMAASVPTAPLRVPPNVAQMSPVPVNGVYTANPPGGPAATDRFAGTNSGVVAPGGAVAEPALVVPPVIPIGAPPPLPGKN